MASRRNVGFAKAGTEVFRSARVAPAGSGLSYSEGTVTLLEDSYLGSDAGWDVVDVQLRNGGKSSAYAFDLHHRPTSKRDPARRSSSRKMSPSVMVWDNGGETADRYTVAIEGYSGYDIYGMSSRPNHPQGFNQYSTTLSGFNPTGWGTRVLLKNLPAEVKRAIDLRKSEMRGGHSGSSYAMYPASKRRHNK